MHQPLFSSAFRYLKVVLFFSKRKINFELNLIECVVCFIAYKRQLANYLKVSLNSFPFQYRMKIVAVIDCFLYANALVNSLAPRCCSSLLHYVSHAWDYWLDLLFIAACSYSGCISVACVIYHMMAISMITRTFCMLWIGDSKILTISKYNFGEISLVSAGNLIQFLIL